MYSMSSQDLVDLCPKGDTRCSFHSRVSYSCVSSQRCQSHLCLLSVFSSEFAAKIQFTNILDFGKSMILSLLLASACHYSMTAAKVTCKLNSEQKAVGRIWPLGSILLALVLHILRRLTSLDCGSCTVIWQRCLVDL